MTFKSGDRVVKNPETWTPSEFDGWGAGEGVGVVVEPPFILCVDQVDVVWPGGREFRMTAELLPAPIPPVNSAFDEG